MTRPTRNGLALSNAAAAKKFFETRSDSAQRHHVDNITSAKAPATRQRRYPYQ
ncbi:MAG: YdeI/OmpD-associated family protein [Actinomycetota bacterium]